MKWLVAAILFVVLLLVAASAALADIRLEAEDMTASHNIGGFAIEVTGCGAASGFLAVDGLDVDGEWLRLRFTLNAAFCFVDSVRSAGDPGLVREFALSLDPVPSGESGAPDTLTTVPGSGIT